MSTPPASSPVDPRVYQITCLTALLVYGVGWLDFEVQPLHAVVIIATAQLTQLLCSRNWSIGYDPKSAMISALSLCLLVRTNHVEVAALAAFVSIASKFVLRWNGKHVWNPTNLGIIVAMLLTQEAWVSPGQWGNQAWLAFLFACIGGLVVNRATRSDVTYAFLFFWLAMVYGRSWSVGEPMTIPTHRLQSGALLLFTFFMISDPKTTPNTRAGRVLFAFLVASGAYVVTYKWFRTDGLLWSLVVMAPLVPLIDRLLPGDLYQWSSPQAPHDRSGGSDERLASAGVRPAGLFDAGLARLGLLRVLRGPGGHEDLQPELEGGARAHR